MSVDVSRIKKDDRVKVSLYDLPESDWLEVKRTSESRYEGREVLIEMPEGGELWVSPRDIIAHEPAAPELPDWLAARVIKDGNGYLGLPDMRAVVFATGAVLDWQEVAEPVTVIVDRDGNLPAAEGYRQDALTEIRNRRTVEVERDEARAAQVRAEARAEDYAGRYETSHASRMHAEECLRKAEAERNELRSRLSAYHSPDAGEAFDAFHAEGIEISRLEVERDEARADLAAFRAEVEKVRDDVRNLFDYQIEQRLDAILDGADQ